MRQSAKQLKNTISEHFSYQKYPQSKRYLYEELLRK